MSATVTALIADDEPILAAALAHELNVLWPDLALLEPVGDGDTAIDALLHHRPQIAFLDISMPGASGLEVAQAVAEEWEGGAAPLLVFVTAHDEHAIAAYELAALDYITKPVQARRLKKTVQRLQAALGQRAPDIEALASQIGQMLSRAPASLPDEPALTMIRASVGGAIRLIPVEEVVMFESADKYVNVATADGDALIRESLRELMPRLDPHRFVQIHRSRIVNLRSVTQAQRDEDGKLRLTLNGREERPIVSRVFAHLFKAM